MTKNLSASFNGNGSVWTPGKFGPVLRGRRRKWDEYISDPSLTILNNGSLLLLYKGWSRGEDNQIHGKIGIAVSHTGWRGPFVRYGSRDGVLLSPPQKNISYSEPYLFIDRHGKFHVFLSRDQLLHALQKCCTLLPRTFSRMQQVERS